MATEILTVSGTPMPLDLLLFKRFGREVPGLVEATWAANYGLADLGPILPRRHEGDGHAARARAEQDDPQDDPPLRLSGRRFR